jgi:multiple sugar transport system permease protein
VLTVVLGIIDNSMAAFALSRLHFSGQKLVLGVILATLIVPFETLALPLLWWCNQLPWIDENGLSFSGWSIRTRCRSFRSSPTPSRSSSTTSTSTRSRRLDEAATVDGAGWFRIYRSVDAPRRPGDRHGGVLTFLPAWNSYLCR